MKGRVNMTNIFRVTILIMMLLALLSRGGEPALDPTVKAAQNQPPPQGDIVFIIDESGSMLPDINEVRARVDDIVNQLQRERIDFRLGLIGFGTVTGHGQPPTTFHGEAHIHTALTDNVPTFRSALDDLVANGGFEPGFSATILGVSDRMGFRPEAGVCVIMITDEDADDPELQTAALTALRQRNDAVFFGIVDPTDGSTKTQYGMPGDYDLSDCDANPSPRDSLARETCGQVFDILEFRRNAQPVLDVLLQRCAAVVPIECELEPETAMRPVGTNHTVTATVRVRGIPTAGITVNFEVTRGPNADTRGTGITDMNGQARFTYTGRGGPGTDVIRARVVVNNIGRFCTATIDWGPAPECHCVMAPATATSTVVKPHTVTAAVIRSLSPREGVSVSFRITEGPNAGTTGMATTNALGQARFTYTSVPMAGTDTIAASGVCDGASFECTATKVWKLPTEVSGIIDGETWTPECSPYLVVGDIQVVNLTILPGVEVLFQGNFIFEVTGTLTAIGKIEEPILFTRAAGVTGWRGILFNFSPPGSELAHCTIERSTGSGIRINNSSPTIRNCTIRQNSTSGSGGGIFTNSALTLTDCVISNNSSGSGGGIFASGPLTMRNCTVLGNSVSTLGEGRGGGIYAVGPLDMSNCAVSNNSIVARSGLGGGIFALVSATLMNCIVSNNSISDSTESLGGGVLTAGTATLTNCVVSGNAVPSGQRNRSGGSGVRSGMLTLTNCTVAFNINGGLVREGGEVKVVNSIIYFNTGAQISGTVMVTYSDVQGGFSGEGNINLNPLISPGECDLRIIASSPCIDAGNPDPSFNDVCRPPSLGTERNDMGAHGGPKACGWLLPTPCPPSSTKH
jgi:hypothetical protein